MSSNQPPGARLGHPARRALPLVTIVLAALALVLHDRFSVSAARLPATSASTTSAAPPVTLSSGPVAANDAVPGSCFAQLELALVLDGSFSIAEPDFVVVRNFAALTVSALQVRPGGGVRTGIVQFSSQGTARVEADLSDDPFILGSRIFGMPQIQQETDIQEGVELGQRLLLSQARPGIQQVMVVFTDGRDNEPGDLARQAEDARTAGIFLIAVGVGPDIDLDQLNSIASAGQVFTPATYPELLGLVGQLVTEFCPPTDARGQLTSPIPSSKLSCGPQSFAWTAGQGVVEYRLMVGSRPGLDDLFSYRGTATSASWSGQPEDGRLLFITLASVFRAQTQTTSYVLAACTPACPACDPSAATNSGTRTTETLPPARCNDQTNSGGAGVTTRVYDMATNGGTFRMTYDTYTIPDKIDIYYEGTLVFTTGGFVSEGKEVSISFGPGASREIAVVVTGNTDESTIWDYTIQCPMTTQPVAPTPARTPTPTPTRAPAQPALSTQTLSAARCNDQTNSGGAGITTRTYEMGTTAGTFRFAYETYTIPDRIDITYQGRTIFSTGGYVAEGKEVSVSFGPGSSQITVIVTGNVDDSTVWDYTVYCPGGPGATGGSGSAATPTRTPTTAAATGNLQNLSLSASASASSTFDSRFPARMANDGDRTTAWFSAAQSAAGTATYTLVLHARATVSRIEFYANERTAYPTGWGFRTWRVELLGSSGQVLFGFNNQTAGTQSQIITFPPVQGVTQVRFTGSGFENPASGGFSELWVMGVPQ